jgi:calcineurin-like phosphoesterase family protein
MKLKYTKEESERLFFTSDLHFDHANIIKYCNRPYSSVEEMNQVLITNWNEVITDDDTVFILGDVTWGNNTNLIGYIEQMKGHKILIKGNHDNKLQKTICDKLFDFACDQLRLTIDGKHVILNHYPFLCFAEDIQLFGHIHSGPGSTSHDVDKYMNCGNLNQLDVGVDNMNYKPVSWKEILEMV